MQNGEGAGREEGGGRGSRVGVRVKRTGQVDARLVTAARALGFRHGGGEVRGDRVDDEVVDGKGIRLRTRLASAALQLSLTTARAVVDVHFARRGEAGKGRDVANEGRRKQEQLHGGGSRGLTRTLSIMIMNLMNLVFPKEHK